MSIFLSSLGYVFYSAAGLYGLIWGLNLIHTLWGVLAAIASFFLFPFLITLAPWYGGLVNDDWTPLLIIYGLGISGIIVASLGKNMK